MYGLLDGIVTISRYLPALIVMTWRVVLLAGTASIAACTVVYLPLPSEATVGVALLAAFLKAHCLLVLAVQVSWMTAVPEVVEAPWSLMQSPLLALMIWKVLVPLALSVQSWLLWPVAQLYCWSWVPEVFE